MLARKQDPTLTEIASFLNKNPRTIYFHLKKLRKLDLIEEIQHNNEKRHRLVKIEIVDFLIKYKECLFDENVKKDIKWLDKNYFRIHGDRLQEDFLKIFFNFFSSLIIYPIFHCCEMFVL